MDIRAWRWVALATAAAGALCLGGCSTAPPQPQPPPAAAPQSAQEQQAAMMRAMFASATQRDDFVEGITGMRRDEPVFPAVKSSLASVFGDPVIVDWMIEQMTRDRAGFEREWGRVAARGMMAVDDATALKLVMPIVKASARMSAAECQAMAARKTSGKKGGEFFAMLRTMEAEEVRDFFEGMRRAVRAGIRGDAPRPASTQAQMASALTSAAVSGMKVNARSDSCGDMLRVATALDKATPQDRTHILNYMLSAAGLVAQGQAVTQR